MKKIFFFGFLLFTILACSKEPAPCYVSSYIGTWKVKDDVCGRNNSPEVVIMEGPTPSQIQLVLGIDTLVFRVAGCQATHYDSDVGWKSEGVMKLDDDVIELEQHRWTLFFLQICNLTLVRK